MLRTLLVGLALGALTVAAVASSADAPADETFGPFKYTPISVRTKITALGRSYRERWADNASIVHDAGLVESSFRVWAQRYPKDRWLAPTAYHLAQLYQELQSDDARAHARSMYDFVAKNYPSSKEAHFARLRLAQGFPALHAESPVLPTPNPYGSASVAASPSPEASAAPPSPSSAPSAPPASTMPSPATSASPKPR